MWKLDFDSSVEMKYLARFKDGLVDRILNGVGNTVVSQKTRKALISDYNAKPPIKLKDIEILLVGKPQEAYDLNNRLMKKIFEDYDKDNLESLKPHKKDLKKIEKIFYYGGVISGDKDNSYWLANLVGHNTCTYCNRQYTFTVGVEEGGAHITRPQFDHWFPKERFPLLSLNLYNLIPSCSICNSSIKGSVVFSLDSHIHPYLQTKSEPDFKFVPKVSDNADRVWTVCLERARGGKEDNTIKAFCLDEIYGAHGDLEVKNLMDFATGYTDNYLRDLYENVLADFITKGFSKEEVFRMLFGAEYLPEHTLDMPLSKLKRDVLKYLGVI